jgi:tRNA (adenine57-N1/adenine58-N1)-methyltransferase catalytic subunit
LAAGIREHGEVRSPLQPGEEVLLVDGKNRRYLVQLAEGGEFHTHAGVTPHDAILGRPEGVTVRSNTGARYLVLRPTLAEFVLSMPRGAQVIYPKDLGPLLVLADIFPGARVLEAGVGSVALSIALLRAGASVTGYELRDDFARVARKNVVRFLGDGQDYDVQSRDVYEGIELRDLDRVVLDLPEPWRVVKHAEAALHPGGIFCAYLPTIGQVAELHEALAASAFGLATTIEVLQRSWHVKGQSVRPDHRMVAHTGFLTAARLLSAELELGP